uniref:Cytochrome c oxidase subunit 7A1, mitochondrial n=1 Tax=Oryzias sinensis TaxID=183150 RepID=A0A8C7ZUR8_9TELE
MNRVLKVPVLLHRAFSSSARRLRNKVPEAQKLFQEDNGLPVHIKGGTSDVLLYRATMTLTIAGKHSPGDGQEPEFHKVLLPIMRGNQSSAGYPGVCPPNGDQPDLRWSS